MTDIFKKIKDWDLTNKDANITLSLDYTELSSIGDIVDRKLWFNDEVTEDTLDGIVYSILRFNAQDKGKPVEERKPILLYLNSPGGSVYDGTGVCDAIIASKTPIYTICLSNCCSMGLVIYLCGHKRYAMPNSIFLMHEGYGGDYGASSKVKEKVDFDSGKLSDSVKNIILSHTKLTKKQYEDKYRQEWYFLADEGKKYGFVDYIIGEDCDIDEII